MTEQDEYLSAVQAADPGTLNDPSPFHCGKCGRTGEAVFSWDGKCLGCEDDGPDEDEGEYEKQQMGSGW